MGATGGRRNQLSMPTSLSLAMLAMLAMLATFGSPIDYYAYETDCSRGLKAKDAKDAKDAKNYNIANNYKKG